MKRAFFVTGVAPENGGHAIAARFAREGYDVFVTAMTLSDAEAVASDISSRYGVFAKGYKLELRSDDVYSVFADIDSLGYTVSSICLNAADLALGDDPSRGVPFFENTPDYFRDIIEANLVGNFKIVREAALRMKQTGGAIVFIGSNTAYRPNCNRVAYVASKGGICSMSRSIAVDLGVYGIRSNVVMPGTIKTKRWVAMGDKQISNGTMVPIGDISDFEDIANAVWYLGSDQSKNVTGTELVVDGGMTAQLYPDVLNEYRRREILRSKGTE